MELIYGTHNPIKYEYMVHSIADLDIVIININSIDIETTAPDENGNEPLHNAKEKALGYYKQIKRPVFSCDSGLYFRDVDDAEQLGVKVRRINGKRLNDDEMIEYYMGLAGKYGGRLTAYYKRAICVVMDENNIIEYDGEDMNSEEFYLVDKCHETIEEGVPLDAISVEIKSGKYYYDLTDNEKKDDSGYDAFYHFFKRLVDEYD